MVAELMSRFDAVPKAFADQDASQCGFCTPGFVIAVRTLLNKNPKVPEEEIRNGLNGNICRCGTYANIVDVMATGRRLLGNYFKVSFYRQVCLEKRND